MGRLRKDKGEKPRVTALQEKESSSNPSSAKKHAGKKSKGEKDSLKEQVIALGGDEVDLELVKGVGDGEVVQGKMADDVRIHSFNI